MIEKEKKREKKRRERKREGRIDRCFSLPPNSERESQLLPNVERERRERLRTMED